MSKGNDIKIDEEDLAKITENIAAKLIRIKQGIINPSFMISITPTDEKEAIIRPKIEIRNGTPTVVGREEIKTLADKMSVHKQLT